MNKVDGYNNFIKSGWIHYRDFKCLSNNLGKQEYLALDVNGNTVIIIMCCSNFECYAIVNNKRK